MAQFSSLNKSHEISSTVVGEVAVGAKAVGDVTVGAYVGTWAEVGEVGRDEGDTAGVGLCNVPHVTRPRHDTALSLFALQT